MKKRNRLLVSSRDKPTSLSKRKLGGTIILLIIAIAIGIVIGYFGQNFFKSTSMVQPINTEKVDSAIARYITLYYGLLNVTVLDKHFEDGIWTANVSAVSRDYLAQLEVKLYDSNLSVFQIVEKIPRREKPATIYEIPGKVSCSQEGKIAVDVYIDPYDYWSRKYDTQIESFLTRFQQRISPIWRIVRTQSMSLSKNEPNTLLALNYLECTKNSPLFLAVRKCIYSKYEMKNTTLNENEILECVQGTGISTTAVQMCVENDGPKQLSEDETFGVTYLGEITTPMIVIDCRYRTWPIFAEVVMCHLYPELEECKE
jgi:hypothetical protein